MTDKPNITDVVNSLPEQSREYFPILGVFAPHPATFDVEAAKAIFEAPDAKEHLDLYVTKGLLNEAPNGKYSVAPEIQEHALSLLDE